MTIIPILLFLLTFYFYEKKKDAEVLTCMLALVTNCFAFVDSAHYVMKPADFVLLPTYYITLRELFKNKKYFRIREDRIAQVVLLLLCFLSFEFLRTIIFSIDSFANALRVVRIQSLLLLYFYLRRLSPNVFSKFLNIIFWLSLVQGVCFYLQLVGVNLLVGRVDEAQTASETSRYMNGPELSYVFVIYYLLNEKSGIGKKVFVSVFFGGILLLGMTRSTFIGLGIACMMYLLVQHKTKHFVYMLMGYLFFMVAIQPIFENRDKQSSNSTMDDIQNVLFSGDLKQIDADSGTFSFRIGMLMERWMYLLDNPSSLPFGVGCIHEESPANDFYFLIGTRNQATKYGRGMIESGDITWVPLLLRYGVVGVFLFGLLYCRWVKMAIVNMRRFKDPLSLTGAILAVYAIFRGFFGSVFDNTSGTYTLLLFLSLTVTAFVNSKKKNNEKSVSGNNLLQLSDGD